MIKFRHAFISIGAVLVVHIVAVGAGLYQRLSWFDIPMHYFGGFAIAILGFAMYERVCSYVSFSVRSGKQGIYAMMALQGIFVIGTAVIVGVGWEWYEFLFDQFATTMVAKFGMAQMGLPDTMDDLFNDTLGALTAWFLLKDNS